MSYQPFALKYRPQTFEEIVGQEHVARTLRNAVAQGRVHHAYIFAGPRGTGKTSTARVLAKALNCEHGPTPDPCGACAACKAIQEGRYLDVIEVDAASQRGIEEIRALREAVGYTPAQGRCKVYILDEAHQITKDAFNAFLKTLEEPPPYTYFVMATTEPWRFPPTIMSRCQRFDFRAIPTAAIVEALRHIAEKEDVSIDEAALWTIAEAAGGAMRDAESIFDQVVAYAQGPIDRDTVAAVLGLTQQELLERTLRLIAESDLPGLFALMDELVAGGKDLAQYLKDLTGFAGDLLRVELGAQVPAWAQVSQQRAAAARDLAARLGRGRLMRIIPAFTSAQDRLREGGQEVLTVELALAEAAQTSLVVAEVMQGPLVGAAVPPSAAPAAPATEASRPRSAAEPVLPAAAEQPVASAALQGAASAIASATARRRPTPPPAAVPEGGLTLAVVQERWGSRLQEELKRMQHAPLGGILRDSRPVAVEGDVIHLLFQHEFHYKHVSERYCKTTEEALSRILGQPVRIKCHLGEAPQISTAGSAVSSGAEIPAGIGPTSPTAETAPAPEARAPSETPAPGEALEEAVRATLALFEGSREIPER